MNNPTSMSNIEAVLGQIRNYQAQAQDCTPKTALGMNALPRDSVGFGDAIKGAIQEVNSKAMESKALRTAYEHGEDVPLTDVVIGMQKSSLAFEATLQIRNKVLKAYEDILHMPV